MGVCQTALKDINIVFLQSGVQVCTALECKDRLFLWRAQGRHAYCLLLKVQDSYTLNSFPAKQPAPCAGAINCSSHQHVDTEIQGTNIHSGYSGCICYCEETVLHL